MMKRLIISTILAAALVILLFDRTNAKNPVSSVPEPKNEKLEVTSAAQTASSTAAFIYKTAKEYGVNPDLALCIVNHESGFNPLVDAKDTGGTISRGLWQINNYWHSEVPDEVTHSVVSSTIWSLGWIKRGHVREWSTYKKYCSEWPILSASNTNPQR